MPNKITPILIVGANRSGTTWLSNLLCNHSKVAGVQSPDHFGIIETNMFGRLQSVFGDLNNPDNWAAFVEAWSKTDFFATAGASKRNIYDRDCRNYVEIFRAVMDQFATRASKQYWLQKLPPTEFETARELAAQGKIVVIVRKMLPNIASKFGLLKPRRTFNMLARAPMDYALQYKLAMRVARLENACFVSYEDLASSPETELTRVCDFLGLEFEPGMTELKFQKNSSFETKNSSDNRPFSTAERMMLGLAFGLASCIPIALLVWLATTFRNNNSYLIPGTYRGLLREQSVAGK